MMHVIMLQGKVIKGTGFIIGIAGPPEIRKRQGIVLKGFFIIVTQAIGIADCTPYETPELRIGTEETGFRRLRIGEDGTVVVCRVETKTAQIIKGPGILAGRAASPVKIHRRKDQGVFLIVDEMTVGITHMRKQGIRLFPGKRSRRKAQYKKKSENSRNKPYHIICFLKSKIRLLGGKELNNRTKKAAVPPFHCRPRVNT